MQDIQNPFEMHILGVGGTGKNALEQLPPLEDAHYSLIDTDLQSINASTIKNKLMIGRSSTKGMSAGSSRELGQQAAQGDQEFISDLLKPAQLLFMIAGLAGGTGAGASVIAAECAVRTGAIVIAFVAMPFSLEGQARMDQAEQALADLRKVCHAVIVIPNDILFQEVNNQETVFEAFSLANSWIARSIESIASIICKQGLINLDFNAIKEVFFDKGGKTLFSLGSGSGNDYVTNALKDLMLCPLMHLTEQSRSADTLLVNLVGGKDLSINAVNQVLSFINERLGNKLKLYIGAVIDDSKTQCLDILLLGINDFSDKITESKAESSISIDRVALHRRFASAGQGEFGFVSEGEVRGYFEPTDKNHHAGQDLDVPTYLRKGIKIEL